MDLARYAELFRTETREHLVAIDAALSALRDGGGRPAIDALFRSVHTIKGMAGAMGYEAVEQLAHALESLLAALRETTGELASAAALVPLLQEAADALAQSAEEAGADGARRGASASASASALLARLANATRVVGPREARPEVATRGVAAVPHASSSVEPSSTASSSTASSQVAPAPTRRGVQQARIDLRHLDALLDLAGELVIARDRLVRAADASGDRAVRRAAADASRLVSALQEEVLAARLVPVGQVFDRFPRLVRDMARELGKDVAFDMAGRELALDRSMLDAIVDPVVHLLRNAVDHGLETPDERVAAGKPVTGRLLLRAARERDGVRLEVTDDGRGIDRTAVRARAVAEGRLPADAPPLDDEALVRVLAQPGFSTAARVSTLSGRGVGVDVVATRARSMGGTLSVHAVQGQGTTFALHLPVTLAIVRALLVRVGADTFAVPAAPVREASDFDIAHVRVDRGRETLLWHGDPLPLVRLRPHFGMPDATPEGAQVLLLEVGGRRLACLVDALVGQQDIVVKPYDAVAGAVSLFSGATILGDGRPALIVDTGSLA
ncbi:MAG TPA: chemotaxis protein CheA [Gemmatimonadaceae bacterium]|nr:chemotaxis protein CheA [Gemmatimonadaceae bacterium]